MHKSAQMSSTDQPGPASPLPNKEGQGALHTIGQDLREPLLQSTSAPSTCNNQERLQPSTSPASINLDRPLVTETGGLLYLPFPASTHHRAPSLSSSPVLNRRTDASSLAPLEEEPRAPVAWPEPEFRALSALPRTKSYILLATTIAGQGPQQPPASTTPSSTSNSSSATTFTVSPETSPTSSTAQAQQQPQQVATIPATTTFPSAVYPELDYLQLIFQASLKVYDVAVETPLQYARNLSTKVGRGNRVYFKREELQPVFSFKIRGAYNRMVNLTPEEKKRGVIAMSAGNHAQGVAMSAQRLGIKATIVMPTSASEIKYTNVRRLGATVILYGADLEEAKKECLRIAEREKYVFIPPFDDPYVIAGQGTCGMEIIRQMRSERVDAVFVPVGGGGLISGILQRLQVEASPVVHLVCGIGIAAFLKRVQPDIKIIGVNTVDSFGMATSLVKGQPVQLPTVGLFSDGTAVKLVGNETHRICSKLVDDMVLVSVDEICAAIKDVFDDTRSILEPSGALGVAGIKKFLAERGKHISGGTFIAVTSGANMNFDRLRFVSERTRIGEGKECLVSAKVKEQPGSFLQLYGLISPRPVTEISYRYSDPKEAHMYIAFEVTGGKEEMTQVVENIHAQPNMTAIDITANEMAKSHLRFLAGGRAPTKSLRNEKLYRFSFPERPGSLKQFLHVVKQVNNPEEGWNLTLIHYRNTGGDVARFLLGMDVPKEAEDAGKLDAFLKAVGYEYTEETQNPVYEHYLR